MLKKYSYFIRNMAVISIIVIVVLLMKSDPKSTINEDNNFSINDTSLITKVFLADRHGKTITLEKHDNFWKVNNQFIVRNDVIRILLSTANKISIKKPVSKNAFENVIKYIATSGIYVEFYEGDNMVKSYTIGSNTPDHLGTYMLLKGSEKPYVIHIPFFNGFLSPRYGIKGGHLDINNWRSTKLFDIYYDDIEFIRYTDYLDSNNSYFLSTNPLHLINVTNDIVNINNIQALKLLNSFKSLNCEVFRPDLNYKIDSLVKLNELIVNNDTLTIFNITELFNSDRKYNYTVDRKYATLNSGDLMLIQDYVFNKVLINIHELMQ